MLRIKPGKYKDIEIQSENQFEVDNQGMVSENVAFSSLGKTKQRILTEM